MTFGGRTSSATISAYSRSLLILRYPKGVRLIQSYFRTRAAAKYQYSSVAPSFPVYSGGVCSTGNSLVFGRPTMPDCQAVCFGSVARRGVPSGAPLRHSYDAFGQSIRTMAEMAMHRRSSIVTARSHFDTDSLVRYRCSSFVVRRFLVAWFRGAMIYAVVVQPCWDATKKCNSRCHLPRTPSE
jgi:hypothetical protein